MQRIKASRFLRFRLACPERGRGAETEHELVVRIPVILEVVEIEVEVAIGVRVHVRHPVVAVRILPEQCMIGRLLITESNTGHPLYFIPSLMCRN